MNGKAENRWPPADAREYVRGRAFLDLLAELADEYATDYGGPGGLALVFDWFDRQAAKNPALFQRFRTKKHLRMYLIAALRKEARRAAVRWKKKRQAVNPLPDYLPAAAPPPSRMLENEEFAEAFRRALFQLSPLEQTTVHLILLEGHKGSEVADLLKTTSSQVSRAYRRGLERLADALKRFA